MIEFSHLPVLLQEVLDGLAIDPNGIYIDGTAGGAGHSVEIAKQLSAGRLIALDQDPSAVEVASARLQGYPAQVVQANFRNTASVLNELGIAEINGALLDLGVSSHQLDTGERGFSYHVDAPLDMRMSQSGKSAADVVNTYSPQELARILRLYADEQHAWEIAKKIAAARQTAPIETTGALADIVASALPPAVRRKEKNPARKTFQAVRMEVNGEMDALEEGLNAIFEALAPGGRLCVITFHSIEDRLVKQQFKEWATGCTCPPDFPVCVCGKVPRAKLVSKKPVRAREEELAVNPRSRSASLRILEKL